MCNHVLAHAPHIRLTKGGLTMVQDPPKPPAAPKPPKAPEVSFARIHMHAAALPNWLVTTSYLYLLQPINERLSRFGSFSQDALLSQFVLFCKLRSFM